jgi:hypothetical protein
MTPFDFVVTRLQVKVTGALNVGMVCAHYLENYLLQSLHTSHIDWPLLVDVPYLYWDHYVKGQGHRGLEC